MPRLTLFVLQLLLASHRLRALAAGVLIGCVANGLFARADSHAQAPAWAALVILAGAASVVFFMLDSAPRRDRATLVRLAQQALLFVGTGILLALHLPALMSGS